MNLKNKVPPSNNSSDLELIEQAGNNDCLAMKLLINRYQQKTISIIKRYVNTNAEAQDISQEVLIKLYLSIASFNQDASFNTWHYRIVMNTLSSYFRKTSNKFLLKAVNYDDFNEFTPNLRNNDTPEEILCAEQTMLQLTKILAKLPKELLQVFILIEVENYSYQDVSTKLNCPIGTIRSRIHRARQMINPMLSR